MPDTALMPRPAFAGLALPGRHGRTTGAAGVTVSEGTALALASVVARRGREAEVAADMQARFGVTPPATPRRVVAGAAFAIWTGPGQWLAGSAGPEAADFVDALARTLAGLALVADQSDGRGVLYLGGPQAREVLIRGVPIDLHPRVFKPGDTASTLCSHIDVQVSLLDDGETFELVVARGFCGSFWHWLEETAAPYGLAVVAGGAAMVAGPGAR